MKKTEATTGRPKKDIDEKQVFQLASINCSYAEIAAVVGCDSSTLTRRFAQAIEKGRESGKMSLKRKMWETAMGGNVTMMIWLSKQMLGYTEKVEQRQESNVKATIDVPAMTKEQAREILEKRGYFNENGQGPKENRKGDV